MQQSTRILGVLVAVGLAAEAAASGAGGAIYVPARVKLASHARAVGHGNCETCQRLGFACVDHETPAPCTAEGVVYPKQNTFGWAPTRWRTWPGTSRGDQTPQPADPEATRDVIERPAAEDEDRQAPPPIEDTALPEDYDAEPVAPAEGGEGIRIAPPIELPPIPGRPAPEGPIPAPAGEDPPPALPFGFGRSAPADNLAPQRSIPRTLPVVAPKRMEGDDAPPPLPAGFTQAVPAGSVRRLPRVLARGGRIDTAVQTASAELPRW